MKFGKVLENNANVEWRESYVQYKRLKRLIKRVAFEIEKKVVQQQRRASTALAIDTSNSAGPAATLGKIISKSPIFGKNLFVPKNHEAQPLLPPQEESIRTQNTPLPLQRDYSDEDMVDAKNDFWNVLDENLKIVNDFYLRQIALLRKTVKTFEEDISQEKQSHGHVHARSSIEHGFAALQNAYDTLTDLKTFVQTNYTGFRKIFDKTTKEKTLSSFLKRLELESFYASNEIDHLLDRVFLLTSKDKLEAGSLERRSRREHSDHHALLRKVKLIPFAFSIAVFILLLLVRITPQGHDAQQRCLAMLVFITLLWITEAIPYFATALLVPPLVVFLQILGDKSNPDNALPASKRSKSLASQFHKSLFPSEKAAKKVMSLLVNHTTILIMGGYSISAAFGKCQIELYIAAALQRRFKKRPNLFLLAIMLMGLFLSMWISNHTAPVLCVSVLLPIIRDFPTSSAYVKTLLVGLAFACNLGGMMTPISSLQNTLAVSYLEKAGYSISFGQWMAMAVPFCTFTTILCWAFLLWVFDPKDAKCIPQIVYDQKQHISRVHVTVIALTLLTILLWATFTFTSPTFGDLGIISLIFMFVMFGTGILSQFDFNSFSWHILFLIGGGNVLGDAVQQSGLLDTLSHSLIQSLPNNSVWLVSLSLSLVVLSLTTFVSHTVASIIMLPIIVQISVEVGHPHIPVICCALAISAAMALPFSSFPNINSLLVLDDHGQPYLKVQDFLRVGIFFSLITVFLIVTIGYGLILAVFGFHIPKET
ncbi:hypothetical protein ABG067_004333 [Albugo candida]